MNNFAGDSIGLLASIEYASSQSIYSAPTSCFLTWIFINTRISLVTVDVFLSANVCPTNSCPGTIGVSSVISPSHSYSISPTIMTAGSVDFVSVNHALIIDVVYTINPINNKNNSNVFLFFIVKHLIKLSIYKLH